jgi:hypothetical protein
MLASDDFKLAAVRAVEYGSAWLISDPFLTG